ncbi:SIR2 family protein [Pseudodesulfovibrio sp. zrk46]|uniref:SIR2 family protein n=1 Tax=Pseudodesulfovibrio sp. zrk46 TaxID=2725288 RepID=UPI001448AC85|nr:SIR2 family protein [Pseudodesulfovibrio sp. zrk46]QJB57471.1 hypothetical protein HFN16_14110 [Pseudodesulfovibrio sp. zrk46]
MSIIPPLIDTPDVPQAIINAAQEGQLVLFVGAGLSRLAGLPSWPGLASKVLNELRDAKLINYSELSQLEGLSDSKKKLTIASLIAETNGHSIDYNKHLQARSGESEVYEHVNRFGCPCVTTNYDELLSPIIYDGDDSKTPARNKRVYHTEDFHSFHQNDPGTVVHLHGSIADPKSMVITTRDYLEHYDNPFVQEFLGRLFQRKTVLFVGYGLEEAEILEHILRRGGARTGAEGRRFLIQGFFSTEAHLYSNLYQYYRSQFGVHLVGFVKDQNGYEQLGVIAESWANAIQFVDPGLVEDLEFMDEVLSDA